MINNHVIFQAELKTFSDISIRLLDALCVSSIPVHFGIKRKGYYMLHANRQINNFEGTKEVEVINLLFQACSIKGYSLIMLKI